MKFRELPPVKEQLMKCVRCGKCRSICPVFAEIRNETVAPRGHVFMVQMLRDGKVEPTPEVYEKLAYCLMCENCSVNCPSGIDVHELNAAARSYIYSYHHNKGKEMIFDTLWTNPAWLKKMKFLLWGAQKSGLQSLARRLGLTAILPGDLPQAEGILENIPRHSARDKLPFENAPLGDKRFRVGYFLGCATDLFFPHIAQAVVRVLTANGCEVIIPPGGKCCGLPHIANGKIETAQSLMQHNLELFNRYNFDYIIGDCASCTSALSLKTMEFILGKGETDDAVHQFARKVIDVNKFLIDVLDIRPQVIKEDYPRITATYHDPCHLRNAQNVKDQPRELLRRVPGVTLVEMEDANRCCGGSGTYSLTHYDLSMKILDKKMQCFQATGADYLATCCPSCIMQLKHGLKLNSSTAQVVHTVELLDQFYRSQGI